MIFNSTNLHAEKTSNSATEINYNLGNIKQSSAIDTQKYIWKFEIQPNLHTKTIKTKLLNPHPQWTVLNKRAIEIAQQTSYSNLFNKVEQVHPEVSTLSEDDQNKNLNITNKQSAHSTLQPYTLSVEFIPRISYKSPAQFRRVSHYFFKLCKSSQDSENALSELINNKDKAYKAELNLSIDTKGQVANFEIFPAVSDANLKQALDQDLKKVFFLPYNNEQGILMPFKVTQPLIIPCVY